MSIRGLTLHVRDGSQVRVRRALSQCGVPVALLGSNRLWTTFVPFGHPDLHLHGFASVLGLPVLQVFFDEDTSVTLVLGLADGRHTEASFPFGDESADGLGAEDEKWLASLQVHGVASATAVREVARGLRLPTDERDAWLLSHGLETALRLPFVRPVPVPCQREDLLELTDDVEFIVGARAVPASDAVIASAPASRVLREWTPDEAAIVDLHVFYWSQLWSMNNWRVYNRYKKHLPADRRREVDAICEKVAMDGPEANIRVDIERVLATTWDAEDWLAVARDPANLKDEPISAESLAEWARRLTAVGELG